MAAGAFYQDIGVAPVRYAFEAEVKNGRLRSIVSYIPTQEIKRIAAACKGAKIAPRIHSRPCAEVESSSKRTRTGPTPMPNQSSTILAIMTDDRLFAPRGVICARGRCFDFAGLTSAPSFIQSGGESWIEVRPLPNVRVTGD